MSQQVPRESPYIERLLKYCYHRFQVQRLRTEQVFDFPMQVFKKL